MVEEGFDHESMDLPGLFKGGLFREGVKWGLLLVWKSFSFWNLDEFGCRS